MKLKKEESPSSVNEIPLYFTTVNHLVVHPVTSSERIFVLLDKNKTMQSSSRAARDKKFSKVSKPLTHSQFLRADPTCREKRST